MSRTQAMLDNHPSLNGNANAMGALLDRLDECAQVCALCADACLSEDMVADLRKCIRLNLDCVAVCITTADILGRQTDIDPSVLQAVLQACLVTCEACAAECEIHADMHEHCRVCAEACRECAAACRQAMSVIAA